MKYIRKKILRSLCICYPTLVTNLLYYRRFGKKLNLKNPTTFNEKLQWLKLNTYKNNPLVTQCADKYKARDYIKKLHCEDILNDIYYAWDSPSEIDWDNLPNKFVLKCNHGAGYNIVCRNKKKLNKDETLAILTQWMKEDYWKNSVELCYKDIPKKIICEKFIETKNKALPLDYKVFCFHGKAEFVMICTERESKKPKFFFMDKNWNLLPYGLDYNNIIDTSVLEKPIGYEKLFFYAEKLSKQFPFVRADFYLNDNVILFGELTFTPAAGLDIELNNKEIKNVDIIIGNLLDLNKI
ncbi:ATP-grasp fold amidoligase family protein [Proteus terrae]|uniref:ATP-grasp fold amidoligase family protein n=1 Tax=Proteus terrae TaxID=1574161 RepID=UPI002889F0B0|nr:ATP-grasp fold amidoligase family protein [Proteus terrae]